MLYAAGGWLFAPEVSFSVYGERGVIDLLAFHPASGCLLVIELKTAIIDVNDLVGTMDRRCRLAAGIRAGARLGRHDGQCLGRRPLEHDEQAPGLEPHHHAARRVPG